MRYYVRIDDVPPSLAAGPWPRCLVLLFIACLLCYGLYSVVQIPVTDGQLSGMRSFKCDCLLNEKKAKSNVDRERLFYNRVPKCGSTTMYTLIRKLSVMHNYVHFNSKIYDKKNVDEEEQRRIVQQIKEASAPCSFDRHVFFINFTRFGETPPLYINIIREPVERIISSFFYRRVAAKLNRTSYKVKPSAYWLNKKFEHCVTTPDPECTFLEGHNYSVLQLPYFCGQELQCQLLNDPGALQKAKQNIVSSYAVVGVLEQMNITLRVLERVLPSFFGGAFEIYHSLGVRKNQNLHKERVPEDVKEILKANLTAEYELYHFVLQRLYQQYQQLVVERDNRNNYLTDGKFII